MWLTDAHNASDGSSGKEWGWLHHGSDCGLARSAHDRRVLIVDDNGAFRAAARLLLERAGFAVVAEAESGAVGVEEATAHSPDVAIVDVQLPDFDGFEVAARLAGSRLRRR